MKKLTKDDILLGVAKRERVELPQLEREVEIRPLTEAEAARIRALAMRGLSDKAIAAVQRMGQSGGSETVAGLSGADLVAVQQNEDEANVLAASFALTCDGETWTPEDVGSLPPGVAGLIAKAAYRISGIDREGQAQAKRFCADTGSGGSAGNEPDGVQA